MATARGSAVPLQSARVEHPHPLAGDGHGDAPAPRAAPLARHADFPFPVRAFYLGALTLLRNPHKGHTRVLVGDEAYQCAPWLVSTC